MIICVVGKSGSGKNYICELLKSFSENIIHLDIDIVAHEILKDKDVIKNLYNTYGTSVVSNNQVNRKALSNIVFNSEKEMDKLTEITWPPMEIWIDKYIEKNKDKIIILNWQNLLKTKYYNIADLNILVTAPFDLRLSMAVKRDNICKSDFITREKASYDFENKKFDYVIENDYTDKIRNKVREIYVKSIISR